MSGEQGRNRKIANPPSLGYNSNMIDIIAAYFATVVHTHERGDATEHTYRPALKTLVETFDPAITATNEPARQRCGAPDYVLTKNQRPLGYIEAKTIGKNLDSNEYQEQFERYLSALSNLIITDYLRFQFWQNGSKVAEVSIGEVRNKQIHLLKENFGYFESLLRNFCNFKGTTIRDADELAALLAKKARVLSHAIFNALNDVHSDYENRSLHQQFESFINYLIPDIDVATFSDTYAQTVVYGMFVGRYHHKNGKVFSRVSAVESIPKSHPFLRKLFGYIASLELDDRIRWIIDELADMLQAADLKIIMENFGKQTQTEDPTIHFYETFLAAYNPALRKDIGAFYTPQSAVHYIIRAVDDILKEEFDLPHGLADHSKTDLLTEEGHPIHRVQILDPATGTGTFLAEIVRHIHANIVSRGQQGTWNRYVADDLLPRLHGFEILMAPYAMAHLKLDTILEQLGYRFEKDQRLGIYLTNALERGLKKVEQLGFMTWLIDEAEGANRVKKEMPVMVVLGNPPYNNYRGVVAHYNETKYAKELIEQYKKGLGEKKTNIDNDYVKFIALGQNFLEKNPESCGILAYVSNNSFLDGITFRQMRKVLLETFDKIYILNLHGDARKKESAPDGSKDENVFDIMQGNSINIFIKNPAGNRKKSEKKLATVFYADLFGKRQIKYDFLTKYRLKKSGYVPLKHVEPYYFFTPKDFSAQAEYEQGFSVTELFPLYNSGIKTDRDELFIDFDKDILAKRIKMLLSGNYDWWFEDKFRIVDSSGYKLTQVIKNKKYDNKYLQRIAYRLFDNRWIYYDPAIISRPGYKAMLHLLGNDNYGLIVKRGFDEPKAVPAFVSKLIIDGRFWTRPGMLGAEYIFPLYVYPPQEERRPNFNPEIVAKIEQIIGKKVKPEKLFDYIYAVLHSPKYRKDYEEFLKIDFPRIPYPSDNMEFERFAKVGQRLRELHLLEKVPKIKTTFPVADGNVVENVRFVDGKVYINKTQYFGNVPADVWNFYIGGYQPLQKYLKDRKGRILTFEEIQHYQKIVAVLQETMNITEPQS